MLMFYQSREAGMERVVVGGRGSRELFAGNAASDSMCRSWHTACRSCGW